MKKSVIICTILALSVTICLCSCASKKTADTSLKLSSKYESISDIYFKVPISWEKRVDNNDYLEYGIDSKEAENLESMWIMLSEKSEGEDFKTTVDDVWRSCLGAEEKNDRIHDAKREAIEIEDMTGVLMSYIEGKDNKSKVSKTLVLKTSDSNFVTFSIYVPKDKEQTCDKIISSITKENNAN